MKRMSRSLGLALVMSLAMLPLSGCVSNRYHHSHVVGWSTYPYYGWYDGFYGPFYDGYWGTDGDFYYRLHRDDRVYHRDDRQHFRHDSDRPDDSFHRFEGRTHQPPEGTRMPNFRMQQQEHNGDQDRDHH